jgi:HD-like signal output (HDOD) protein/CheY-like chemotaxis protein
MARRAMHGILARGNHRLATVDNPMQAWDFLHRNPGVDLIFTELKFSNGGGLPFIEKLKQDPLLKLVPVVVYTEHGSREAVKQAIGLRVQNFLVKPYHDDDIFAEIDKSDSDPWRNKHFEEEKSFCKLMGYTPAEARQLLVDLVRALAENREAFRKCATAIEPSNLPPITDPLIEKAEAAGAWCLVECLQLMTAHAQEEHWPKGPADLEMLDFCHLLIACRVDPSRDQAPDFGALVVEASAKNEAAIHLDWSTAAAEGRCPLLNLEFLCRQIDGLKGCPVIDSAAAAFQMVANGHRSCINPLMDVVARDPGLSAQMLIAANAVHPPKADDFDHIEDARLAVGLLGEVRLQQQARTLVITRERVMNLPPGFNWTNFWTYQRGVARIAQTICRDLEFNSLEPAARTAGQLHDIGKLILAHLHPVGFRVILEHARSHRQTLAEAEKLFLGCTTMQLAAYFADRFGLSRRFANVMRWIDDPAAATADTKLVAIISLARDLCRHNQVGTSGDPVLANLVPIEETAEWAILKDSVYPSFNLHKFEVQIHAQCGRLRTELSGHQAGTIREMVGSAAN